MGKHRLLNNLLKAFRIREGQIDFEKNVINLIAVTTQEAWESACPRAAIPSETMAAGSGPRAG